MTVVNVTDGVLKGSVKGPTFTGNVDGATFTGSVTYTDTTTPPVEPPPANTDGKIANFNAASGSRFTVGGVSVSALNANKAWSLVKIDDYTLEMTTKQGDFWSTSGWSDSPSANRSEIEAPHSTVGNLTVTEKFTVMPGPISTASFVDINQYASDASGQPSPFAFTLKENTDFLQVILQSPTSNWNRVWRDSKAVTRGKEYDFKLVANLGTSGKVDVWLDGTQIVTYRGSVGASGAAQYYWKWGCYRKNVPEALTIRHKNMKIVTG